MRNILLIFFLFFSISASATVYQVGTGGNLLESNIASTTFQPDDQLLFKCGETFIGGITISQSGTSGHPIIIGKWGTGSNPIITGFTTVSSWTNLGSNIWESTNSVSTLSTCNMVTVNGINTAMGRYPNADAANGGYLTFQSHVGHTSITTNGLTGDPNWTGAEVVVRTSSWTVDKTVIASQSGGTLNYLELSGYVPVDGYGFFIQKDIRTLDVQNEWYYNPSTKKILIYSTSQPTNVKISTIDTILIINGDYVTVDGIDLSGANKHAIYNALATVDHTTIQNCNISFVGQSAITTMGSYLNILSNTIANSNDHGVDLSYTANVVFRGNTITDIGSYLGMGMDGNGTRYAVTFYNTDDVLIEYNTVKNIGYKGIDFYGNRITVKNNYVDTFGYTLDDGGGIYTFTGTDTPMTDILIQDNIVLNGVGAKEGSTFSYGQTLGIYFDNGSTNIEMSGNTVAYSCLYGANLAIYSNINVHDNTFYDNGTPWNGSQFGVYNRDDAGSNNSVQNNIFVSTREAIPTFIYRSTTGVINTNSTFDYNYHISVMSPNTPVKILTNTLPFVEYSLAYVQTNLGYDLHSSLSPYPIVSANDLYLAYNTNTTVQNIAISAKYKDLLGVEYDGIIELQPYSSKVLFYVSPATPVRTKGISAGSGKVWGVGGVPYGL